MEKFTGHVTKGDVVVVSYPFSDGSDAKIRPALVIAEVKSNIIVCVITHNSGREGEVILDREDFHEGKLNVKSFIHPTAIITISKTTVLKKVGSVKDYILQEVLAGINQVLNQAPTKALPASKALERPK